MTLHVILKNGFAINHKHIGEKYSIYENLCAKFVQFLLKTPNVPGTFRKAPGQWLSNFLALDPKKNFAQTPQNQYKTNIFFFLETFFEEF